DEAHALALVSAIAGAVGIVAVGVLFGRLGARASSGPWAAAATAVAATSPLYWFTANRPLSDMSGLAAALAVQAMALGATGQRSLAAAAFVSGFATGLRSQVAWLTLPLLIVRGLGDWGTRGLRRTALPKSLSPLVPVLLLFGAGVLLWFIP